ncbi:MAG: two-component system response regulator [Deltaproteobacteria bacterium RIFOXYD12_FULL_57_12]|nr:MAG: two-component system response regulator [Deltaproteobacteria bacterium RIFOXYD12_FULL_57_12]
MQTILIVDDEDFFRDRLARAFAGRGYGVFPAADYDEAIKIVTESKPALAVVDLKMPGKSGLELLKKARNIHPEMRVVILTGYGSIATATEAVKLGAVNYLPKPADVDDILNALNRDGATTDAGRQDDFEPPSLARTEWEHINRVLADCGGNISEAAKKLGLHRRTLQRKLYKFAPSK